MRGGQCQTGIDRAGNKISDLTFFDHLIHVYELNGNGFAWACLGASWSLTLFEPVAAHVAFAHDAQPTVVFRNVVRAHEQTILTADALVVEVFDDAGDGVFLVGIDRAALKTARLKTVMAGAGHGLCSEFRRTCPPNSLNESMNAATRSYSP